MIWTRQRIAQELRKLEKSGASLSYLSLQKRKQPLISAAAYHFGSYKKAVQFAGIDYADVSRRPRWTKQTIIAEIKKARRGGRELHWSAVTRKKDELARAAFASLQPRLFGKWDRALQAAGLDADDVTRYRSWDRNTIAFELRERHRDGQPVNSGTVQKEDASLHAAALRHFKGYANALRAAGIDPARVRQRRSWDRAGVVEALRRVYKSEIASSDAALRGQYPALYGAAVRIFGSFAMAKATAQSPRPKGKSPK